MGSGCAVPWISLVFGGVAPPGLVVGTGRRDQLGGESFEGLGPSSLLEGADAVTLFCGEVQKEKCHPVLFQHQNILIILEFP